MTQINYPYFIRKLRDRTEFSQANNNYLDQLERILEQIYGFSTNDAANEINAEAAAIAGMRARMAHIEYLITDDPFTIDSSGWTIDTSEITIDTAKA